jgi:hypothetical protein
MNRMSRSSPLSDSPIPAKGTFSFELVFRPSIDLISITRDFVVAFYTRVVEDQDTAYRLALVTHELLENAAKYSTDGEAALFVELDTNADTVTVRATNRATVERIAILEELFAEIAAAPNAHSLYMDAMRRSVQRASGSGGLGLARIWAEGEMQLSLVRDDDRVELRACGAVRGGQELTPNGTA